MPTVSIEMFSGRTPEQKQALAAGVTEAVVDALGVERELVRVKLYEIERYHSATGGRLAQPPP